MLLYVKKIIKKLLKITKTLFGYFLEFFKLINPYLYFFYYKNLKFSKNIEKRIGFKYPLIDKQIIYRKPKLKFENKLITLNEELYSQKGEVREDASPYTEYFDILKKTFDLNKINSFLDVGCSTGWILYYLKKDYQIDVCGLEYFEYQKDNAHISIREKILIKDLRENIELGQFEIVNCTEVGEHIEPAALDNFLENLNKFTKKYLIMTWSSTFPPIGGPPQHVSSLEYNDFVRLLETYDFKKNNDLTKKLIENSKNYKNFNYWWRDSITVFEKVN